MNRRLSWPALGVSQEQSHALCTRAHTAVEKVAQRWHYTARLYEAFALLVEELARLQEEAALLCAGTTEARHTALSPYFCGALLVQLPTENIRQRTLVICSSQERPKGCK